VRFVAAVVASLASATLLSDARAQQPICNVVRVQDAGLLEDCGNQLRSFFLILSDLKREVSGDFHGHFAYRCSVELMCDGESTITGFYISPDGWQASAKDEAAIFQALQSTPIGATGQGRPGGPEPQMPSVACPIFDVSVGGLAGRAVCFDEAAMKGGNVVVVAADNDVGFLLVFYRSDQSAAVLREKVVDVISRFKIERATGDVSLLRWMQ
jgi:hypothetical protein